MATYSGEAFGIDWKAVKSTLSHPFQSWEAGAKELEKTTPGRIVTAPIRLPEAIITTATKAVTSTGKAVENVPDIVKKVPLILGILAVGVAGYLIFAGKRGTNLVPQLPFRK